ncbi:hypothetical protein VNO78_34979 [Psophocarpus tetragonolobus]|uniref:Uncharacterized protein n=1 Tax=Psophocarpus tetragonolobus TaxID=3891 RepID=A0AAN9NMZ8_PSOTE
MPLYLRLKQRKRPLRLQRIPCLRRHDLCYFCFSSYMKAHYLAFIYLRMRKAAIKNRNDNQSPSLSFRVVRELLRGVSDKPEEDKQTSADVLFLYSKFTMACIGCKVRPCDLRFHLMKEISGIPSSLNRESPQNAASPDAMGESSSTGTARLDRADSFKAQYS